MPDPALTTGPPDFIGVGTQRSGTTWWQRLLRSHPNIHLPLDGRKEQHFFDWFGKTQLTDADIQRYHAQFPRPAGELAGEWTPRYMRDVWTPRLLARAAPGAKLLVMFRDPVERYRSGVLHTLSRRPARNPSYLSTDAVDRGRYAVQLRRIYDYFDRSQVLVLQFERCVVEPLEQFRHTLEFIGAAPDHAPEDLTRTRGTPTSPRRQPIWEDIKLAVTRELEEDVADLTELVPDLDLKLWPNFEHLAAQAPKRTAPDRERIAVGRPRGEHGGPPDFVGVGTSHSGWDWWHGLLTEHPAVKSAGKRRKPNLGYFSEFAKREMTAEDVETYHSHFTRPDGKVVGEWSPEYMYETWVPMLLHRAAPDAKLLVMLVNPFERWRAQLGEAIRKRDPAERTSNRAAETDHLSNSLARGRYARQLRSLLDYYGRDQILVLQLERCVADPEGEYRRTLRFLGVDEAFRPAAFEAGALQRVRALVGRGRGVGGGPEPTGIELWEDLEIPLHAELDREVAELRALVPEIDLSLWPEFAHLEAAGTPAAGEPATLGA